MKTSIKAIVAATVVTLAWTALAEDAPATKPAGTCPMMSKKASTEQFANPVEKCGKACGETCTDEMKKKPETCPMMKNAGQCKMKQAAAAAAPAEAPQATVTVKAQETCPVMGGKINKDLFVDYDGKRIYVCCGGCIETIKKDPALYLKKLQDAGVLPAATPEAAPEK